MMKELRFNWMGEVWRVAFAFDPLRQAVLLVAGDKSSVNQKRFYAKLIDIADARYKEQIASINKVNIKDFKNGKKLDDIMASMPKKRRSAIENRAMELATLKDLRHASEKTQEELAALLGVGQDTISRLEKRSDMLLSTLRHYVECMGGKLELVAKFPNRPPVVIEHLGMEALLNKSI